VRNLQSTNQVITITDRGEAIAFITPIFDINRIPPPKVSWANRKLLPGYAKYLKAGKLKSTGDSSICISEDRTSRDDSVAGLETYDPVIKRAMCKP
jgi:hypothetical protein